MIHFKIHKIIPLLLLVSVFPQTVKAQYTGGNADGDIASINNQITMGGQTFWIGGAAGSSTNWNTPANWWPSATVPNSTTPIWLEPNSNGHNLVLDQNRTIHSFNFNGANKSLVLGNFSLTISETIEGNDANNYIKTTGTGQLIKAIAPGSSFTFPVGNTAYNPVTITNKTGTTDSFSVRILDEVYYQGTTGLAASEPRVKRTWLIDKTSPTANAGDGVDFVFGWNAGEATTGLNTPKLYHYNGTTWDKQTIGTTTSTATSLTYTGYKGSFSPFAIGDDVVLLPITWLSFRCEALQNQTTLLQWKTASETNTRAFFVERSNNGSDYTGIGEVPAAGYSQSPRSYSFSDPEPTTGKTLYRVRMEDMDGHIAYSEVCSSNANQPSTAAPLKVYPNPTRGGLYMVALEPERNFVWEVYTPAGKQVASGLSKDGLAEANMHHLSEGVYIMRVTGSGLAENHRIIISR